MFLLLNFLPLGLKSLLLLLLREDADDMNRPCPPLSNVRSVLDGTFDDLQNIKVVEAGEATLVPPPSPPNVEVSTLRRICRFLNMAVCTNTRH
jgi:hypothetical protein